MESEELCIERSYYGLSLCAYEEEGTGDSMPLQLRLQGSVIWLPFSSLRLFSNLTIFTGFLLPYGPHYAGYGELGGRGRPTFASL